MADARKEDRGFLDEVKYVLQRRNSTTGMWQTKGLAIIGKTLAQNLLNTQKKKYIEQEWRAVPKAIADAYKQGWLDCHFYTRGMQPVIKTRRRTG